MYDIYMSAQILLYIATFFFVWYGSGLIVSSASKFSKRMHLSPFVFSFLFLGLLTSIPEFSVGMQATATGHPEIFVGNLLGGVIVLFLVIIPLLAVIGNGTSVKNELHGKPFVVTMTVILAPAFFVLDGVVTKMEGLAMVVMYLVLMFFIQSDRGVLDQKNKQLLNIKRYSYRDLLSLLFGLAIVFVSSRILLDKTLFFAETLGISAFYLSLIVVALGTDLPEFILAIRSSMQRKRDVAMGDYVGAAAASTLLFGVFTLLNKGQVITIGNFYVTFFFIALSLVLFFLFSRSKQTISRKEGFILFGVYSIFIATEIISRP